MKQPAKFEPRKVADLTNWDNNPRSINKEDFERLKEQIKTLGVYKTLLVNQDNIVLGGNMRLQALTDLGIDEVMCGIVETKDDGEMLQYALSDNDQAGQTDDQKLAEVFHLHPIDTKLFKVQSNTLRPLESIINPPDPFSEVDKSDFDRSLDSYLEGNIKQIVLYFENAEYESVLERLEKIKESSGLGNHTEIFLTLLSEYENNNLSS